ncbi:hypothetical protein [Aeromonas salmonicida]|uniref:hypothetical protein n=1 Tax=Aeromonas salmonicida TaxID=645 RepID=UPI003D7155F1
MKRFTHDADLRGMVVLRSLGFQLVPFKLHRFRKQRPLYAQSTDGWLCCHRRHPRKHAPACDAED